VSRARGSGLSVPLATAYAAFAATFRGPRSQFWRRMSFTGLVLGALALAGEPSLRRTRLRRGDLALGAGGAAALYGIFRLGDRMARRIMPRGEAEIDAVYGLRSLRPASEIAARLTFVIGPAEELFWRGLVQSRLTRRYGPARGAALAAAAYGGAHVVTGNATLVGAASVAGAFWSTLAAGGLSMGALIAGHALWDLLIFLVAPTTPSGR
jgi:membrane protease YdiL (CAAX protease family)